jgi:hypothetical protein
LAALRGNESAGGGNGGGGVAEGLADVVPPLGGGGFGLVGVEGEAAGEVGMEAGFFGLE